MDELCNKSYLVFRTSTAKSLSCTDYEIITKMIIPPEALLQLSDTYCEGLYNYGVVFNTSP
jgi:hypothetical protein